jgi:preprotein translocase subunit YajC
MNNSTLMLVLYFGVIIGVFYIWVIRPQQRQRKAHAELLETLEPGTRIVTNGGLHGTVTRIEDDEIALEVSDGVVVTVARAAVAMKAEE